MLTMQSIADFIVCTALCNSAAITLYTCEHTIHVYRRSREPCTYCVRKKCLIIPFIERFLTD